MLRRILVVWIAVVVSGASGALAGLALQEGTRGAREPVPRRERSQHRAATYAAEGIVNLPCTAPRQALNFSTFWAGVTFDGLRLNSVLRRCDEPYPSEPIRANYVAYLYGDCTPASEAGCAAPIEVQSFPVSERNKSSLEPHPGESRVVRTDTVVNGIPASWYDDGHRLEIYRLRATVVVYGSGSDQILRFAEALVRAPTVLTDLESRGLHFESECIDDLHYCPAEAEWDLAP